MRLYRVESDPRGRLTLTVRDGDFAKRDLTGKLQGNADKVEFYRAVAGELACAAAEGAAFTYDDFDDHSGEVSGGVFKKIMTKLQARAAITELKRQSAIPHLLFLNSVRKNPGLANNPKYQTSFRAYYEVRQKPREFYDVIFSLLQRMVLGRAPLDLQFLLLEMHYATNEHDLSLGSKLLATASDNAVVYDNNVAVYFGVTANQRPDMSWLNDAMSRYTALQEHIRAFIAGPDWAAICDLFDKAFPQARELPSLRKANLILEVHVGLTKSRSREGAPSLA